MTEISLTQVELFFFCVFNLGLVNLLVFFWCFCFKACQVKLVFFGTFTLGLVKLNFYFLVLILYACSLDSFIVYLLCGVLVVFSFFC